MMMVRTWLVVLLVACHPVIDPGSAGRGRSALSGPGTLDDHRIELPFDGGHLELELYREGTRIVQTVRNRYAVSVTMRWTISALDNVESLSALAGTAVLPAADAPLGTGQPIVLAELQQIDPGMSYHRELHVQARFGDPSARPDPYVYALPYPAGLTFAVLQGFHGAFSHRGSNEYAVDFNCPVATPVVAARPGVVVATNARAQGSGTESEFLDDRRANFVLIQHDDGTLGEYMHLSPSGVRVKPGQTVARGQSLGLSGNTGFSSTPHLHFQLMTAAEDGIAKRSFPFQLAVAPRRVSPPIQGQRYSAWE
jgi:murein DD-endopeptidase MepM/ murein hydrolase activator NlpD